MKTVSFTAPNPAAEVASAPERWVFSLSGVGKALHARGLDRQLPAGPAETLDSRVRAFFAERAGAGLLVGALPFDRAADDMLFSPLETASQPWAQIAPAALSGRLHAGDVFSRHDYADAVRRALVAIRVAQDSGEALEKVVLARALAMTADAPIDPHALWARLAVDPQAVRFVTPISGPDAPPRYLVGASPELLVSRKGDQVVSHPLAGSAPRSADMNRDEDAARALLASEKDRREHAMVTEAILDLLAPLCRELNAPTQPALVSTRTMWHLGTRIIGRLRAPDEVSAARLAALLHPTPAVCGAPRDAAMRAIRDLEPFDRGFYAGAVGWTAENGDGDWYVSLRCAELEARTIRLYAGAGIVAGSDPEAEAAETAAKLQTMLRALGVDEHGAQVGGAA